MNLMYSHYLFPSRF